MRSKIIVGDALAVLRTLEAESVQLTVTSPPYDDLRTYGQATTPTFDFEGIAHELLRVLCDGGVLCWNVGNSTRDGNESSTAEKQKLFFQSIGFRVRTLIYEKANFSMPANDFYHRTFEFVYVASKGKQRCFNPIKDRPNLWAGTKTFGANTIRNTDGSFGERPIKPITETGLRTAIWRCNTAGQENPCKPIEHPAVMPENLAAGLVQSWSQPGDTVLDPFCGSGTTGLVALRYGRNFVGIELNPEYAAMAERRIAPELAQPQLAEVVG